MPITLILWLIFSFTLLLLFSSLKISTKMAVFFRWFLAMLSLPSAILSLLTFNALTSESAIFHFWDFKLIPLNLGIYLSKYNITLILCSLASLNIFLFTADYFILSATTFSLIIALFFIIFSQLPSDLFITLFILNLGAILLLFSIIISNTRNFSMNITRNFLWLVLSDFLSIMGLLLAFSNYGQVTLYKDFVVLSNPNPWIALLLYFSCFIKIINLPSSAKNFANAPLSIRIQQLQFILFSSLSSIILLTAAKNFVFPTFSVTFSVFSSMLVLYGLFQLISKARYRENNTTVFLASIALLALCFGRPIISEILACFMVLIFPFQVESLSKKLVLKKTINSEIPEKIDFDIILEINFFISLFVDLLSRFSSNILGPFYGNFLLLRIPQIVIGIIQIPLRLFHNGSIQRSILFIVFMVLSYYYIWVPQ